MSRIPASPQSVNAPAPLPPTAQAAPTKHVRTPAEPAISPAVPAAQDRVSPLEKGGGSLPCFDLDLEGTAPLSEPSPVSEAETTWALNLEEKVIKGYQPTAKEMDKYADIAARLAEANPARHVHEDTEVSKAEIKWAEKLEARVLKEGYIPTAEETVRYEDIFNRLQAQPTPAIVSEPVSKVDLAWAMELENKVKQGHQPTAEETARYEGIYNRLQAQNAQEQPKPTPAKPTSVKPAAEVQKASAAVSEEDLKWAVEMMAKVQQGYAPNEKEIARYTAVYERHKAQP